MNWKYLTGKTFSNLEQGLLKLKLNFISKNYPFGRNWIFDAKRILAKEPSVIVDAGANIGAISKELSYWFPTAKIMAFEPVKNTFDQLLKHLGNYPNIIFFQKALGAFPGKITIDINRENTINSIKATYNSENIIGKEEIEVVRLEEVLLEQQIDQIDIIKIDVEGFEFEVLEGQGSLINQTKIILLEVGYEREITKVHFSDVEAFMEQKGFMLCGIYETRRNLRDKRKLWYSNNLYVKKELLNP